jgi:acyl-CoA synthetase (AMP-forming)/AMP-acid ligase II
VRWTQAALSALLAAGDDVVGVRPTDGQPVQIGGHDLLSMVLSAVDLLDRSGCAPGTAVPALVTTGAPAEALLLAGAATGRPLAPLGPRLAPRELAGCVRALGSSVLLAESTSEGVGRQVAEMAGVDLVLVDVRVTEGVLERVACLARDVEQRPAGTVVAYLHTSGTTGAPKPVPLTDEQLGARTVLLQEICGFDADSVVAAASPFHHIAGMGAVLVAMASGSVVVELPRFTLESWQQLAAVHPTHVALVATHVEMIVAADLFDIPSLRSVTYGASTLRESTIRTVVERRPDVDFIRWYGQTEGSPIAWLSPSDHVRAIQGEAWLFDTVGRPLPGVEVRIEAPDATGVGEIWARSPHLAVTDPDGWRHTGDLGSYDGSELRLVGRSGDMIIRGGENVYPNEIEQVLAAHPRVSGALVVGEPDERLGQRIRAVVEPVDFLHPPSTDELRRHAREHLSAFKVPVDWELRETLARTASGKIVRRP